MLVIRYVKVLMSILMVTHFFFVVEFILKEFPTFCKL